ncbi:MAG: hypothetical protein M3N50_13630 [Pseudomonadota bacterium]|nr:hypothetical protein [Pseudomonadota bacterium]
MSDTLGRAQTQLEKLLGEAATAARMEAGLQPGTAAIGRIAMAPRGVPEPRVSAAGDWPYLAI